MSTTNLTVPSSSKSEAAVALRTTTKGTPIRFSVCIPNYNYARYLSATIDSVLAQTYPHFEIIVADNASTDNSASVVESYSDPRIRLVRNRYNIGFAPNLDRAAEPAQFEFMLLLSSDDLMLPNALETYADVLSRLGEESELAVLTSAVDVIDSNGARTGVSYRRKGSLFYESLDLKDASKADRNDEPFEKHPGGQVLTETLRAKNIPALFLATCYSRKLFDQIEGYHSLYRMFPDGHFLDKLLSQDTVLVYVPKRLFAYREHNSNQISQEATAGALKYQVDAYMRTIEFPGDVLDRIGVRREELAKIFIKKSIMERGLQALAGGSWQKAFRCLAFGLATYPGQTLREPYAYAVAGLLCLGPFGKMIARRLYQRRKERASHRSHS
jgi:glycosyltransferase involved in cell wall biosynthesis